MIFFNKPYLSGKELGYIQDAVTSGKISGDGMFTKKCHAFFEDHYHFGKCLLTTSCTDALEMAAILLNIQPGDEVIMPSYTFVSTANAFELRGAKIVFADSSSEHPNIDVAGIPSLITRRTKALVIVHYAGMSCDMDPVMDIVEKYKLKLVEDVAQGIDAYYKGRPLGSFGHLAAFSFHETKNIQCGEGGMLVLNDPELFHRAEIIREKGTNRSSFFRGEVDKYGWVDIGSSFLPSEVTAAFLFAQLECLGSIQQRRLEIWRQYWDALRQLSEKGLFQLPFLRDYATNNAHMFYLVCRTGQERSAFIQFMKERGILTVFHYLSLHRSAYFAHKHDGRTLPCSDAFSERLVRLPLYFELGPVDQQKVIDAIKAFFG